MKEKFTSFSPFTQVILLMVIGCVSFVVISMMASIIITQLYPSIPTSNIEVQTKTFPVQYMLMYYFPFQAGFLLLPGLVYLTLSSNRKNNIPKTRVKGLVWSILAFSAIFLLLPFFTEINASIVQFLGVFDSLNAAKMANDNQLQQIIGTVNSTSFWIGILTIGVFTGIAEELAFRRFLFHHMFVNTNKFVLSLLASSFAFALLHFNYLQFLPLFMFGLVLCLMYYVSGSIIPGMIAHALNNMLNIYWLSTNKFPSWLEEIDLKITIPSTLVLMGLIIYFIKKRN
jgi:membrane protease YdiL (CAAX protease family)